MWLTALQVKAPLKGQSTQKWKFCY